MDLEMFSSDAPGTLVPIAGSDSQLRDWRHDAFVPLPLPNAMPEIGHETFIAVAEARAALAALDNTARHLPNPALLRTPTLRREAQSTASLEGTYAPLADVLAADEEAPPTTEMTEVLNYVRAANYGYEWIRDGRPVTGNLITDLQGLLMRRTTMEHGSGALRRCQVVIGRRRSIDPSGLPVQNARFVPMPPGNELHHEFEALVHWMQADHNATIDPVVATAMSHYQFETLHPFNDGNGRIGRLLIVLYMQVTGVLSEPTFTVSPWFEARRAQYYEQLLAVSTDNEWDEFIRFFADGMRASADSTREQMTALASVQNDLKNVIRSSTLRADSAHALVDFAVANPTFTVRSVEKKLEVSYGRANKLVSQLVGLDVLAVVDPNAYKRRFYAPRVIEILLGQTTL